MDRDQLVADLTRFLQRASPPDGDPHDVLDPAGLRLARQLAVIAEPTDLQAAYLIGWLHFLRYQGLPHGRDQVDLRAALSIFGQLLPIDAELVPEPLYDMLRDESPGGHEAPVDESPAALNDAALQLLQDRSTATDLNALDRAIAWLRQAVADTPNGHKDRAGRLANLGAALLGRFDRTGRVSDLDEAIEVGRAAVAETPVDDPYRAGTLSNLGAALRNRYERAGVMADLDSAINAGRQAVSAVPVGRPDRAGYLSNLGLALRTRFERIGTLDDLDQAIEAGREAVAAIPIDHRDRAAVLTNLSLALRTRFKRAGMPVDLDQAIEASRAAVAATTMAHPARAVVLSNLSVALRTRFEQAGTLADLDAAIDAGRQALSATPADHPHRAGYLSNLGAALRTRFEQAGTLGDLDAAIDAGRQALSATPADHPDRAGYLSNLGVSLRTCAVRAAVPAHRRQRSVGRARDATVSAPDPQQLAGHPLWCHPSRCQARTIGGFHRSQVIVVAYTHRGQAPKPMFRLSQYALDVGFPLIEIVVLHLDGSTRARLDINATTAAKLRAALDRLLPPDVLTG